MPTLRTFFAIYTEGAALRESFDLPDGCEASLVELPEVVLPQGQDELFGPWAAAFRRFQPRRAFLLGLRRAVKGKAGAFFDDANRVLEEVTYGVRGFGLDVLRLWPFELGAPGSMTEEETLAEDVFSVGFRERGEHGFRAETFGLAKLDQREISFEFSGRELLEEAVFMCGHLVDWLMEQGRRVEPAQEMAFGFDRLVFVDPSVAQRPFRGWHPPLIQRLLGPEVFPGVGILEVRARPYDGSGTEQGELTDCLLRSLDQRLVLEDLDLTGDTPHASATAAVKGLPRGLKELVAVREQHLDRRDSGWRLELTARGPHETRQLPLSELARSVPELVRYLALPWGVRLEWDAVGALRIDTSRVHPLDTGGNE